MAEVAQEEREASRNHLVYDVNIEGVLRPWASATITVPQIRTLGCLPPGVAVEEIDLTTNSQRTLREDEVVELKPGLGFAKKIQFRRGND